MSEIFVQIENIFLIKFNLQFEQEDCAHSSNDLYLIRGIHCSLRLFFESFSLVMIKEFLRERFDFGRVSVDFENLKNKLTGKSSRCSSSHV